MTWVLELNIYKNFLFCRFHHFLSTSFVFCFEPVVPSSPEISTFVTGATVAFRADYDGDTLLSADVGGTGSRSGLSGWQRICQKTPSYYSPTNGSFWRWFSSSAGGKYVSSLQGTCTSMVFIDCWPPLLDSTWRCCILWFLDLKEKCIITSEL